MSVLRSLHAKLLISFLILTIVPLVATAIYGNFFTQRALSQQLLERSQNQVHLQSQAIVSALQQVQGDALYLANMRSLDTLRVTSEPDGELAALGEVEQDFLIYASVRPMYLSIMLINVEGTEIASVRQTGDGRVRITAAEGRANHAGTPYFTAAMDLPRDGVYIEPFVVENVPYVRYAVSITGGVLVIDLSARWLLRSLPIQPGTDQWAVIDQNGDFIVYPEDFDPATIAADVPRMLGGNGGSFETAGSVVVYDTVYPSRLVSDSGQAQSWVILRRTPTEVLYASINDFYQIALILMLGAALLAISLALLISYLLVKPIKQLELMAIKFGHDGEAPRLPDNVPNDEVGGLMRTFTAMAGELDRKRKDERRLIERLINAQEEERKLVAYDLHDGLLQQLVGARFYLGNCQEQFAVEMPDLSGSIQRGCDALTGAIIEGRRIIEGLRPAALDDLGLSAAIEDIAYSTAELAGWDLKLDLHPLPVEPELTIGVTLYRIAQEALNNARKHAGAKHVTVTMHNGDAIHLSISDDGTGFDPNAFKVNDSDDGSTRGLGITTMRERASLINGRCDIYSEPGSGTRVNVEVPLTMDAPARRGDVIENLTMDVWNKAGQS
ncbi:MAG: HAMP domain-containing protein [Chloroflexi bacterium]|nr:HAMP domain-containing protein [Chloroflexota bacterium]